MIIPADSNRRSSVRRFPLVSEVKGEQFEVWFKEVVERWASDWCRTNVTLKKVQESFRSSSENVRFLVSNGNAIIAGIKFVRNELLRRIYSESQLDGVNKTAWSEMEEQVVRTLFDPVCSLLPLPDSEKDSQYDFDSNDDLWGWTFHVKELDLYLSLSIEYFYDYLLNSDIEFKSSFERISQRASLAIISDCIVEEKIYLDTRIKTKDISLDIVRSLKKGRVLVCEHIFQDPLPVYMNGKNVASAFLCKNENKKCLKIGTVEMQVKDIEMAEVEVQKKIDRQHDKQMSKLNILESVNVKLDVVVGELSVSIGELTALSVGDVITTNQLVTDPVELYLNGNLVGTGDLVVVGDNIAVRVREVSKD